MLRVVNNMSYAPLKHLRRWEKNNKVLYEVAGKVFKTYSTAMYFKQLLDERQAG